MTEDLTPNVYGAHCQEQDFQKLNDAKKVSIKNFFFQSLQYTLRFAQNIMYFIRVLATSMNKPR